MVFLSTGLGLSRFPKIWDSKSIIYSKDSILFAILWPKTMILNQFGIAGSRNRLSPKQDMHNMTITCEILPVAETSESFLKDFKFGTTMLNPRWDNSNWKSAQRSMGQQLAVGLRKRLMLLSHSDLAVSVDAISGELVSRTMWLVWGIEGINRTDG